MTRTDLLSKVADEGQDEMQYPPFFHYPKERAKGDFDFRQNCKSREKTCSCCGGPVNRVGTFSVPGLALALPPFTFELQYTLCTECDSHNDSLDVSTWPARFYEIIEVDVRRVIKSSKRLIYNESAIKHCESITGHPARLNSLLSADTVSQLER